MNTRHNSIRPLSVPTPPSLALRVAKSPRSPCRLSSSNRADMVPRVSRHRRRPPPALKPRQARGLPPPMTLGERLMFVLYSISLPPLMFEPLHSLKSFHFSERVAPTLGPVQIACSGRLGLQCIESLGLAICQRQSPVSRRAHCVQRRQL